MEDRALDGLDTNTDDEDAATDDEDAAATAEDVTEEAALERTKDEPACGTALERKEDKEDAMLMASGKTP